MSNKKVLRRQLASLNEEQLEWLKSLEAKRLRKLVRRALRNEMELAAWKPKKTCCGKALGKMCGRCPRRVLLHVWTRVPSEVGDSA